MEQEGSEILALMTAKCQAWDRYCEDDWCKLDNMRSSFSEGFDCGLCWTHKELTWVLASKSKKEFIDRINKVKEDIENFCVIR